MVPRIRSIAAVPLGSDNTSDPRAIAIILAPRAGRHLDHATGSPGAVDQSESAP